MCVDTFVGGLGALCLNGDNHIAIRASITDVVPLVQIKFAP